MSGRSRIVAEDLAQPSPGPREPRPDHRSGQPEHLGDLARLQPLPQVQLEHLLVAGAQPVHRGGDVGTLDDVVAGVGHVRAQLAAQPVTQGGAAPLASTMVREHATGNAVEPRPQLWALRRVRQPAPRDEERVGCNVTRVLRTVHPPQRETQHCVEVGRIELPEGALAFVEGEGHVSHMSGSGASVARVTETFSGTVQP